MNKRRSLKKNSMLFAENVKDCEDIDTKACKAMFALETGLKLKACN